MTAVPTWLVSSKVEEVDPAQIERDLVSAFRRNILDKLEDTPEGAHVRAMATSKFQEMLSELGIPKVEQIGQAIEDFEAQVLPDIVEKDTRGLDLERVEANAKMQAIQAATNWRLLQDRYVLWALANSKDTGWWTTLGGENEFERWEEFATEMMNRAHETDPQGGMAYDWKWIATVLMPLLRQHGGLSAKQAAGAVALKGKLRTAVSRMRWIHDQYGKEDPELATKMIVEIIENEVLNPEVSRKEIQKKAPGYGGPKPDKKIPAQATSQIITDAEGGSIITIRTETPAQAKAVEMALKGVVDDTDGSAFFPRDAFSLAKETQAVLKNGRVPVQRDPLQREEITSEMRVIVPIQLEDMLVSCTDLVMQTLQNTIGAGHSIKVDQFQIMGFMGKELHIEFAVAVTPKKQDRYNF